MPAKPSTHLTNPQLLGMHGAIDHAALIKRPLNTFVTVSWALTRPGAKDTPLSTISSITNFIEGDKGVGYGFSLISAEGY